MKRITDAEKLAYQVRREGARDTYTAACPECGLRDTDYPQPSQFEAVRHVRIHQKQKHRPRRY